MGWGFNRVRLNDLAELFTDLLSDLLHDCTYASLQRVF